MSETIEAELDVLFRTPPGALVEARNGLAERLRRAGDKAGAARVKAVKRPSPAAWALNQVHFCEPERVQAAQRCSDEVRRLHALEAVDPRALMAAHEAQRDACQAVVDAALAHASQVGLAQGAPFARKVLSTLQALLTGAGAEAWGRLTQELEPSGFAAIESVGTPAARTGGRGAETAGALAIEASAGARARAEQRELAARALPQRERELEAARAIVYKRRAAHDRGAEALARAEAELAQAEQVWRAAQAEQRAKQSELQALAASRREAEAELSRAEAAVSAARAEIERP